MDISLAHYNSIGQSAYSTSAILLMPPSIIQWKYDSVTNNINLAWSDNSLIDDGLKLKYSIDGGLEIVETITVGTTAFNIPLALGSTINLNLFYTNNGYEGFSSRVVIASSTTYQPLQIPTNLCVNWNGSGIARFTWDSTSVDGSGYKFAYTINGGVETVIETSNNYYEVTVTEHLDTIVGKVKSSNLLEESNYSSTIEIMYVLVEPVTPSNFKRERTENGLMLTWDTVDYINNYEIFYIFNSVEDSITTTNNFYEIIIPEDVIEFSCYMKANYVGGLISEPTETFAFAITYCKEPINTFVINETITENYIDTYVSNINLKQSYEVDTITWTVDTTFSTGIDTITLSYALRFDDNYVISTATYYPTTIKYDNEMAVSNSDTKTSYVLNETIITEDVRYENGFIEIASTNTGLRFENGYLSAAISNQNVSSKFTNSMAISNTNLIQSNYPLYTIYVSTVSSDGAPIESTIINAYRLAVPIETEIRKITVCTLGDSITAGHPGYWAESGTGRITSQYQYWLQRRLKDDFIVLNNGYGSDTTQRMLDRFERDVISKSPNYVVLQGGTNDLYWAMAENKDNVEYLIYKMDLAKDNLIEMVELSIANNIVPIIGTLIPRTTAQGIYRTALWDFNTWIINYCNSRDDVYYVDFYNAGKENIPPTPLEEPNVPGNLNPLYDGDSRFDEYSNLIRRGSGVHPDDVGYKLMAEAIPLSIFKSLKSGVTLYIDPECTIEESLFGTDTLNKTYFIEFKNVNRGRQKSTTRYIKNIGTQPLIYSLYPKQEDGLDIKFSIDNKGFEDHINNKIDAGGINKIEILVDVPRFGDDPVVLLGLATRALKTNI